MKQKLVHKIINCYTLSGLAILVIAAVLFTVFTMKHSTTNAALTPKTNSQLAQKTPGNPQFSFDSTGVTGWKQGPRDKISMALFYHPTDCFISVEHKSGTVDVAAALSKLETGWTGSGNAASEVGTPKVTLQTNSGQQQYDLHQYSITGPEGASKLYSGEEFGYIQLDNGYIKIEGYCKPGDQLPATIPALEAIKFNPAA
ncbi:MAG: hypothetical protein ABI220_04505 [Candidatus Saccharimonadales bacterium]